MVSNHTSRRKGVDGKKSDYFFLGKAFQSNDKSENPHSIIFKHILHKQKERSGVKNKFLPRLLLRKVFQSDEISENPRSNIS